MNKNIIIEVVNDRIFCFISVLKHIGLGKSLFKSNKLRFIKNIPTIS